MRESIFGFKASDGKTIQVRKWLPEGKAKAAVLVIHGMVEHSGRYAELAGVLTAAGYAVWAPDHRGHGLTAQADGDWGYFAARDGFFRVMEDIHELSLSVKSEMPGAKLFIFAHSMGSFLARGCISRWGADYSGCILSGTAYRSVPVGLGILMGRISCFLLGPKGRAPLLGAMGFAGYNRDFRPARTPVDWHCKDAANNEAFMADPLCQFICTHEFFRDLSLGLRWIERKSSMEAIPKGLPLWLFAGEMDPVGEGRGRAVSALAAVYRSLGIKSVELTIYPGGRHEMLHEPEKARVMASIAAWFDRH